MTPDERQRYSRQILLPEVGPAGQERLRNASLLLVGAGGLGAPLALYLAAAGVGRIGIAEFDRVDLSNLHRQVLYSTADVGRPKLEAATERLHALNPHVEVVLHAQKLTGENADALLTGYDLICDGSDTFATRYAVNDAAVRAGIPVVFGSVSQFEGQVSIFAHPAGPCYRCLFPAPPPPESVPSCADGGVLGVLPGIVGTHQAAEALKIILGIGDPLVGRMLTVDVLAARFREVRVARDPDCPACGTRPTLPLPSPAPPMSSVPEITVRDLKDRLDRGERPFILDVRRENEYEIANLDGHLIPLDELPDRLDEITDHREDDLVVVHCRTGGRSAKAVEMMRQRGFGGAVNLKGGTHAWSDEIDPSMPKY